MKYTTIKRTLQGALVAGAVVAVVPSVDVEAQSMGLRTFEGMLTPTSGRIERGKSIYAKNCAQCHGAEGRGGAAMASQFDPAPGGFVSGEYTYGGGPVSIYNIISKGEIAVPAAEGAEPQVIKHPAFTTLAYQDRFAVTHYIRSLGPTADDVDSEDVMKQARFEAENGVCRDAIKATIADRVKPSGDEQIAKGKEIYAGQCSSCHGEKGAGDGAAAAALNPPPRNFTDAKAKWTNGSSPLAIFDTLTKGIAGTSMASYGSLSEEDRWALVHYVRSYIPEEARQAVSDEEVVAVCRALSTPPAPPAVPIDVAMKALVEDYPEQRELDMASYGPVLLTRSGNAAAGEAVYQAECASCHGANGSGSKAHGPYGAFPPYLYLSVGRLIPAMAGGTVEEFANRSVGGVHATLGDMTAASHLTRKDWENLHAFVARFEGDGEIAYADAVPAVDAGTPAEGSEEAAPAEGGAASE